MYSLYTLFGTFFERIKTIRILTSLFILLNLILHHFPTNTEERKADEEKRYFDIATVQGDGKKEDWSGVQKKRLIGNSFENRSQRAFL